MESRRKEVVGDEAFEEGEALVEGGRVSGVLGVEALLAGREAVHDHFGEGVGDVAQHPTIVAQVIKLAGADLEPEVTGLFAVDEDCHGQGAGVGAGAQTPAPAVSRVGLKHLGAIGGQPRGRRVVQLKLEGVLRSLQELDGFGGLIPVGVVPQVEQRLWVKRGVRIRQEAHAERTPRPAVGVDAREDDLRDGWHPATP